MSVGGTIIDIVVVNEHKWWVNTIDRGETYDPTRGVAIYCDPEGNILEVGDSLWWQGGRCYWTSHKQYAKRRDVPLKKLSYSGVSHPHLPKMTSP